MAIKFTESAGKHGYTLDDAVYAITYARFTKADFNPSRVPSRVNPTLYIGPSRNAREPLLEVMARVEPPDTLVIFHVMGAREKHLALMDADD